MVAGEPVMNEAERPAVLNRAGVARRVAVGDGEPVEGHGRSRLHQYGLALMPGIDDRRGGA